MTQTKSTACWSLIRHSERKLWEATLFTLNASRIDPEEFIIPASAGYADKIEGTSISERIHDLRRNKPVASVHLSTFAGLKAMLELSLLTIDSLNAAQQLPGRLVATIALGCESYPLVLWGPNHWQLFHIVAMDSNNQPLY